MEKPISIPSTLDTNGLQKPLGESVNLSNTLDSSQLLCDRRNHLKEMHDRLARFKNRHSVAIRREEEQEQAKAKEEQRRLEDEQRLEVERQLLLQELQASQEIASRNAALPQAPPPPMPMYSNSQFQQINFAQLFSTTSNGFGFPTLVSEKEAIDWLRADGSRQ